MLSNALPLTFAHPRCNKIAKHNMQKSFTFLHNGPRSGRQLILPQTLEVSLCRHPFPLGPHSSNSANTGRGGARMMFELCRNLSIRLSTHPMRSSRFAKTLNRNRTKPLWLCATSRLIASHIKAFYGTVWRLGGAVVGRRLVTFNEHSRWWQMFYDFVKFGFIFTDCRLRDC